MSPQQNDRLPKEHRFDNPDESRLFQKCLETLCNTVLGLSCYNPFTEVFQLANFQDQVHQAYMPWKRGDGDSQLLYNFVAVELIARLEVHVEHVAKPEVDGKRWAEPSLKKSWRERERTKKDPQKRL